jgi:hypothetical protein
MKYFALALGFTLKVVYLYNSGQRVDWPELT